jgi:hypothetical protein
MGGAGEYPHFPSWVIENFQSSLDDVGVLDGDWIFLDAIQYTPIVQSRMALYLGPSPIYNFLTLQTRIRFKGSLSMGHKCGFFHFCDVTTID